MYQIDLKQIYMIIGLGAGREWISLLLVTVEKTTCFQVNVGACVHAKPLQLCPTFGTLQTVAHQDPLPMRFSRHKY